MMRWARGGDRGPPRAGGQCSSDPMAVCGQATTKEVGGRWWAGEQWVGRQAVAGG
jgi:hypothetical protein